ncbi:MAG: hypothetical protein K2Y21_03555 [Phycisphaerales bacterium]|nr:hypothetical protein [Phycisphaerales bacterium]
MSQVFPGSYPISHCSGVCTASARPFGVGEKYVAALIMRGEELERRDYSIESWTTGVRSEGLFASWVSVYRGNNAAAKATLSDDEAADLFEQLGEVQAPTQQAFRYILALFLVRRKLFVYDGAAAGVMKIRRRTRASEPQAPIVEVVEVSMSDESLTSAIEQLKELIPDGAAA